MEFYLFILTFYVTLMFNNLYNYNKLCVPEKKELDKIKLYLHMKNITLDPHIFNDQSKLSRYF